MRNPALITSSFPVAPCGLCNKIVLTYLVFNSQDEEQRCCVHCDSPISSGLEWVAAAELEAEGYSFGSQPHEGGGCANGCGTCSARKH